MGTAVDPKFVPAASVLSVVDMKVGDIRTDEALIKFVGELAEKRQLTDAQEAVAVFTARKRGHEYDWILTNLGISESTAKRREIEGMAIVRLQEINRTVAAIRTGNLGVKVVDDITAKNLSLAEDGIDQRIHDLEMLAASKVIKDKFVSTDRGLAISDKQAADLVNAARTKVAEKVEPLNAKSLVEAIPSLSEQAGIRPKQASRTPGGNQQQGPQTVEFHIKAALRDVTALEKAADGEAYVLTTHDWKAIFDLCQRFSIEVVPSPEMAAALETAEKAGL